MTLVLYSNGAADPFAHVIANHSSGVVALVVGGVIGVLLFIVMIAALFAVGRGGRKPAQTMATYEGFAFHQQQPPAPPPPPSLSIPPYPVGERAAIQQYDEAPDPVGVFRTIADPNAAVMETGPMSAVVISSKSGYVSSSPGT